MRAGWMAIVAGAVALAGCSLVGGTSSTSTPGTWAGGIGGGLLFGGPEPAPEPAVSPSYLFGAAPLGPVAQSMTDDDRRAAAAAQRRALDSAQSGGTVTWRNADTGFFGHVVPGPLYGVNDQQCRDYTHIVSNGQDSEAIKATACRTAGGPWSAID